MEWSGPGAPGHVAIVCDPPPPTTWPGVQQSSKGSGDSNDGAERWRGSHGIPTADRGHSITITGWWQLKYFLFSPLFGEDFHFD